MSRTRLIKTVFDYPPIPVRTMDWCAYYDGEEHGPTGHGRTEAQAVQDLLDNTEEE